MTRFYNVIALGFKLVGQVHSKIHRSFTFQEIVPREKTHKQKQVKQTIIAI